MKVILVNRFFHPDTSATSQIASDLGFHLASRGIQVHAVTSASHGTTVGRETVRGVVIHRVVAAPAGPHNLIVKAMSYLRFFLAMRGRIRELAAAGDILIAKTDPPMLSAAVAPIARRAGSKLVVWLQDVFPEVAREYGVPGAGGPSGRILARLRNGSLASARRIVAIGDRMAARVRTLPGLDPDRVVVIHNWSDGTAVRPQEPTRNALRREWGYDGRFVVAYSGNLGRVHEFDTLLDAAERLRADVGIVFAIIGHGPRLAEVRDATLRRSLPNVAFHPHQERHSLSTSLAVADVHLSVLRPPFEGLIQPSKLYGIMAAGRPTLFIGALSSETADILEASGGGLALATGDAEGLARSIRRLRDDSALRLEMGRKARDHFEREFDMQIAHRKWAALLEDVART